MSGVLARTDEQSGIPYLDELSHHMMVIAAASLKRNDENAVISALCHDLFKGMMIWMQKSKGVKTWQHFSLDDELYRFLLENLKEINPGRISRLIRIHHNKYGDRGIIGEIEKSGIVKQIERTLILSGELANLNSIPLKLSGRHRWLMAYYIHKYLAKETSRLYGDKFEEVTGFRRIKYKYLPIESRGEFKDVEEAVKLLDLGSLRLVPREKTLLINLPYLGSEDFYIEYHEGEEIEIDYENNGLRIPYGESFSLFTLKGEGDEEGQIVYLDAGFGKVILRQVVDQILKQEGVKKQEVSSEDVSKSLQGIFEGEKTCVFCGEKARDRKKLGNRFTDTPLLLGTSANICPACHIGYLLEEKERVKGGMRGLIPLPAYVAEVDFLPGFEKMGRFINKVHIAQSISGQFWLKTLSRLWYETAMSEEGQDYSSYLLNPEYMLTPLRVSFAPQCIYPVDIRSRRKKFALESSLQDRSICLGQEKDLTIAEFLEIGSFLRTSGKDVEPSVVLRQLKNIYGITRGLPRVTKSKRRR